jgi:hypothetical protein
MPLVSTSQNKPAVVDLVIHQGSDFSHVVSVLDPSGAILNLTGYTARMQIRSYVDSIATLEDMTTGNGKIGLNGPAGQLTLQLTSAVTAAYTWRSGVYDLEIASSGAIVTRIMQGNVSLSPEVTH